jgi:cell division septation protein DedD
MLASDRTSAAAHQVNNQDYQRYHQQQMDQTSSHVKAETEKPKNQKHNKNRPKHIYSPWYVFKDPV